MSPATQAPRHWNVSRRLSGRKRGEASFPAACLISAASKMKNSFSQIHLELLTRHHDDKEGGFIADSYYADARSQSSAWVALDYVGISRSRLMVRGPAFETQDGERWGIMSSRLRAGKRLIVLRCLRFGEDCAEASQATNKGGEVARSTSRRNSGRECCAFAEVSLEEPSSRGPGESHLDNCVVVSIRGFLEHSSACKEDGEDNRPSTLTLLPALKNAVYSSMEAGMSRFLVEERVMALANSLSPGEKEGFRVQLTKRDLQSVREKIILAKYGIDLRERLDTGDAIEKLLGAEGDEEIRENLFYYSPETDDWRLMIGLMSPSMRALARKHCHKGLILFDGTFGMTKEKILVFFVVTKDEEGKGVLIGVILFIPAKDAVNASASYSSSTLSELLEAWAVKAAEDPATGANLLGGQKVTPVVGMTDADQTEKSAMLKVWPLLILMTCLFHIFCAWRRHVTEAIKCLGTSAKEKSERRSVGDEVIQVGRLIALNRMTRPAQLGMLNNLADTFATKAATYPGGHWRAYILRGGIAFIIDYIIGHWMREGRAESWTATGRFVASNAMVSARSDRPLIVNLVPLTGNDCEIENRWWKYVPLPVVRVGSSLPGVTLFVCFTVKTVFKFKDDRRAATRQSRIELDVHELEWAKKNPRHAITRASSSTTQPLASTPDSSCATLDEVFGNGCEPLDLSSFRAKDRARDDRALRILLDGTVSEIAPANAKEHCDVLGIASFTVKGQIRSFKVYSSSDSSTCRLVCIDTLVPSKSRCSCPDFRNLKRLWAFGKHLRCVANTLSLQNVPRSFHAATRDGKNYNKRPVKKARLFENASDISPALVTVDTVPLANDASEVAREVETVGDEEFDEEFVSLAQEDREFANDILLADLASFKAAEPESDITARGEWDTSGPPVSKKSLPLQEVALENAPPPKGLLKSLEVAGAAAESFAIRISSSLTALESNKDEMESVLSAMASLRIGLIEKVLSPDETRRLRNIEKTFEALNSASASLTSLGFGSAKVVPGMAQSVALALEKSRATEEIEGEAGKIRKRPPSQFETQRLSKRKPSSGSYA